MFEISSVLGGDPWPPGRVLHLVRHGQYESGQLGSGRLTDIGREQSAYLAGYFERLPISRICSSDVPRAVETSEIIAERLNLTPKRYRLLREAPPVSRRSETMQRVQRILNRFFVPCRAPRQEVVICHGNLIRWLMLCAVSGRTAGWRRFLTHHAGITTFLITKEGVSVIGFNQCSHLPARLRTYL